jgi:hypothetical protein
MVVVEVNVREPVTVREDVPVIVDDLVMVGVTLEVLTHKCIHTHKPLLTLVSQDQEKQGG